MTDPALDAQRGAAQAYDALFVPALFGEWAPRVAAAAEIMPGDRVLDVACGTGVLAQEVLRRTGPDGRVAGLDANAGMLAVARDKSSVIDWRQGVAESMPFAEASFDAVVSQFGLMFMGRRRAVREMLRVLGPDGRLAIAVWDAYETMPAYAAEIDLFERLAGRAAADALRAPFVLGDRQHLDEAFEDAGSVAVATHQGLARFPSIQVMVEADLRGWLPVMGVHLDEATIRQVLDAAEDVLRTYVNQDGSVVFETRAHLVTASKAS